MINNDDFLASRAVNEANSLRKSPAQSESEINFFVNHSKAEGEKNP